MVVGRVRAINGSCNRLTAAALLLAFHIERFRYWSTKLLSRWSGRWRKRSNGVRLLVFT